MARETNARAMGAASDEEARGGTTDDEGVFETRRR
jgi:hypothetical protein